jgi:hypothetical protein
MRLKKVSSTSSPARYPSTSILLGALFCSPQSAVDTAANLLEFSCCLVARSRS